MITNPNRFIRGLSDLSSIVDNEFDVGNTVTAAPTSPVGVVTTPTPGSGTSTPSSPSSFTLIEAEFTLTQDGGQNLTLNESVGAAVLLSINGLIQSKSSYSFTGNTLILPPSLNLFTGDVITFIFSK